MDDAHPAPASSERRFHDERESDLFGSAADRFGIGGGQVPPGYDRDASGLRELARAGLVAERVEEFCGGANEGESGGCAGTGEAAVFRQESVTWVNSVDSAVHG